MKRLIAALVIVLGIGTLCFFSMKNVKKIAQKNLHILNEVIRLQEWTVSPCTLLNFG